MLLSTFGVGAMLLAASVAAQDSSSGDAVMVLPVDTPAEPPLPETEDDQVGPKDSKKNNDDKKDDAKVTNRVATAQVTGEVNAKFMFIWEEGKGMHVEITDMKNFVDEGSFGYSYSVNTYTVGSASESASQDTRCAGTKGRLDPMKVTNNIVCEPNFAEYCQLGDLSGKHGTIKGSKKGEPKDITYIDEYLRFYPQPFSILGRSVVITGGDGKAVGCGNIISSLDGTADSKGAATGDKSNYLIKYESEDFELPTTTVNLAIDGTAINTKGLASASLAVPPKIPKASDAADIVLTKSGEKLLAVETTFAVSGSALPTQKPIDGAASSTAKASVLVGFAVLFGTLAVLV